MDMRQFELNLKAFHANHLKLQEIISQQAEKIEKLEAAQYNTNEMIKRNIFEAEKELKSLRTALVNIKDTVKNLMVENDGLQNKIEVLKTNPTSISSNPI